MRTRQILQFGPLLILLLTLTSCGVNSAPTPYTGLTGNWNLAAYRPDTGIPGISFALFQNGTQLTATGDVTTPCAFYTHALVESLLIPVQMTGTLANDGSFTLTEPVQTIAGTIQITIQAKSTSSGWNGTYSITGASNLQTCGIASSSGTFTEQTIAPLTGTYTGITPFYTFTGGSTTVTQVPTSMVLTQGQPSAVPGSSVISYIPLTGTISVQGLSCFTHGSTVAATPTLSQIGGDEFTLTFTMDDGSTLTAVGGMNDSTGSEFGAKFTVSGGSCDGMYGWGSLKR